MDLNMQIKMVWIIIGIITLAVVIQTSSVIGIEYYQLKQNAKLIDTFKISQQHTNSLVVYFSRSGNTELMAYRIAEIKKCNILNLVATDYKIGLKGWVNAMMDARKTTATITPQKVDLSAYDTIYIGSPIWLYSPAPPVFEFVSKNDFEGKKVILFNSMNSKFEQKYIDNFAALVKQNGGEFSKHLVINRGRMTQQMRTDEFLEAVKNQVTQ
jgi:flavodoxin